LFIVTFVGGVLTAITAIAGLEVLAITFIRQLPTA
jgi:hypothetical protein